MLDLEIIDRGIDWTIVACRETSSGKLLSYKVVEFNGNMPVEEAGHNNGESRNAPVNTNLRRFNVLKALSAAT